MEEWARSSCFPEFEPNLNGTESFAIESKAHTCMCRISS